MIGIEEVPFTIERSRTSSESIVVQIGMMPLCWLEPVLQLVDGSEEPGCLTAWCRRCWVCLLGFVKCTAIRLKAEQVLKICKFGDSDRPG